MKKNKTAAKHATVIFFGRVLGELDYDTQEEFDAWMEETGFVHYRRQGLCGIEFTENKQKPKRRYYRKRKKAETK